MTELLEIHTRAQNGRISFDIPAGYPELANAEVLLLISPEPVASTPVGRTDWERLAAAYADFAGHDPYPTITDPVTWQRELNR